MTGDFAFGFLTGGFVVAAFAWAAHFIDRALKRRRPQYGAEVFGVTDAEVVGYDDHNGASIILYRNYAEGA